MRTAITTDVLIAGGGQVGLALALALRRFDPGLRVTLADAASPATRPRAGRASTIVAGGRRLLERLGVWDEIADAAEAVTAMIVTDSRTRDMVRPVFLTFAAEDGAVAHVVPDGVVVNALARAAEAAGVTILAPEAVADFEVADATVVATTGSGTRIGARLLVAADGVKSRLRDFAGIGTVGRDYGQSGIVATVEHQRPHGGQAEEHFLPGGPFAILPMRSTADGRHRSSLVWTEPTEAAERLVGGDRIIFNVELERRFGFRLGTFHAVDAPKAFPLSLRLARDFVRPRFALAGDAAHVIHPIAGQGLNLGYRDVAALAETIVEAHRLGLDIGSLAVLDGYQRWRRFDTMEMALMTDALNRLFANDNAALRIFRDVGLGIVDRLPNLKRLFMREAEGDIGLVGEVPRLLRGEEI
jgi:2-octaprenyl-6-methoxyphenol hydroxylase